MSHAVLIVEDKSAKFADLKKVVESLSSRISIHRASTVIEAENMLEDREWNLLVLDISMDINGTSKGALGGGHANLGGLDIVETMYYEGIVIPTVIVTGLDYFISAEGSDGSEYIGLEELEALVRKKMPSGYLGCIRYGIDGWVERLQAACGVLKW
jgi:CheY-like chemotaxis protein